MQGIIAILSIFPILLISGERVSADADSFYKAREACDHWSEKGEPYIAIYEWWDNKPKEGNTRWCRGDVDNNQILGLELDGLEPGRIYLEKELPEPKANKIFRY